MLTVHPVGTRDHLQLIHHALANDPVAERYLGGFYSNDAQSSGRWWACLQEDQHRHAWRLYESQILIGFVDLEADPHSGTASFAFAVFAPHRGRRLGLEVIHVAKQRATELEITRLNAYVDPTNIPSARALKRASFIRTRKDSNERVWR